MALLYKGPVFEIPFLFVDETLLEADRLLPSRQDFDLSEGKAEPLGVIADLCSRLRERRLFVRAFVFSMHFAELDSDAGSHRGMGRFVDDVEGAGLEALLKTIGAEIKTVAAALGEELPALHDQTLRSYLWLDPPTKRDHSEKVANAFLLKGNSPLIKYSEQSKEVPRWAQAYLAKKDVGFLFCIPEVQLFAFLAVEKILAAGKYRFRFPETSLAYLNINAEAASSARDRLHNVGYYDEVPFTTRPWRPSMHSVAVQQSCEAVLETLRGYTGPPVEAEDASGDITRQRICLWASQFDDQPLVDCAFRVGEKIRLIGRAEFSAAVNTFIAANTEFADSVLVPLGDAKDSGSVVAYLVQDTKLTTLSLVQALSQDKPIIFVDDCIGSGGQTENILADWFDAPKEADLGEGQRQTLTAEQQTKLRTSRIGFVFSTGFSAGAERLKAVCGKQSMTAKVHVGLPETELPTLFDDDLRSHVSHSSFVERCQAVARDLFKTTHPNWDESKLTERLLGYGNKGLLITFSYNTPSQTLTCVWSNGNWRGLEWTPLLLRRPKV